ncbi:Hypothetical protein FRIFI_2206 [Romboutsia hominis]|uniref:Uncharacterized protein n=1 Tax=Romboutsia hominis TaxID=1507512 RepID=A0A2P2BX33_9FIRM|nr:Hypothetical protein FRIFI_2206 [Romboutsia hominis]
MHKFNIYISLNSKITQGGVLMKNSSKVLLGMLCLSTGGAVLLSMMLPGWIWTLLTAVILIGCGVLLFFY